MTSTEVTRAPAGRPGTAAPAGRPGTASQLRFPTGFVWGAATAAYQIEGAVDEDGRTPSIWDTFSHTRGKVLGGDTGDLGVDHYHRVDEDVAIMAGLGLAAYRFSIAWTRILPGGSGRVNRKGVDFYARLVDRLLDKGITPMATLYHWDLPQSLEDLGGWRARETPYRFAEFAAAVGGALGDRLPVVTTLNEPWCSAFLGYGVGVHAPGLSDPASAIVAAHHLNLGHGLATRALRSTLAPSARIALTVNPAYAIPASDSEADREAARSVDRIANGIFLDPVLTGSYPAGLVEDTSRVTDWSFVHDVDLGVIHQPPDVLGVNYYQPATIAALPSSADGVSVTWTNDPSSVGGPSLWPGSDRAVAVPQPGAQTGMGWLVDPSSLTALLVDLHRRYPGTRMMITENGAAYTDVVDADGRVHDLDRIRYLHTHLAAVHEAIREGADVRGYFVWTLLDNFEWAWGYSQRFGIVHVDRATMRRTPKDSASWYAGVIEANALPPVDDDDAEEQEEESQVS